MLTPSLQQSISRGQTVPAVSIARGEAAVRRRGRHMQKMEVARPAEPAGRRRALSRPRARSPLAVSLPAAPAAPPGSPAPVPASVPACGCPAPPRPPSPRARHSLRAPRPPLGGLHPGGCSPGLPRSPAPRRAAPGNRFSPSPHPSPAPSSLLPGSAEGPALGMGAPALLSLLSRRRCLAAALGRRLAPGSAPQPRQGRGGCVPPRPPAPCRILSGSRGGPAAALPSCPGFPLSLALSCRWAARGDSGPRCSRDCSPANSPRIWRVRAGDGWGAGARGGAGAGRRPRAAPAGLRGWDGGGGETWRRAGPGERP